MQHLVQRLLRHSFTNGVKLLVSILAGFGLPPLTIYFVGLETYGAWALIVAISQFVYIADFGFQPALSKYIAEFNVNRSHDKISSLLSASLVTYSAVSIFLIAVLFFGRNWIIPLLFKVNPIELKSLGMLFVVMIIAAMLNLVGGLFVAVLNGFQRMDISSYIGTAGVIVNFVAAVVLLALGFKLWALASAYTLSSMLILVTAYFYIRKIAPFISINPMHLRYSSTWKSLRGVLVLGSSDATNRVTGTLVGSGIRLLLGSFAGLAAVGYYELASRFIAQLSMFPLILSSPLVPAAAELNAKVDYDGIKQMILKTLKYLNVFSLPFFGFSIIFAKPIIRIWLGTGYDIVAEGIQILAIGTYLNLLTAPVYHSLIGMGKPKLGIYFGMVNLTLNVLITVILVVKHGFLGAVIGQTVALSVASCYFLIRYHRQQMLPLFQTHWDTFGKPCLFLAVVSIPFMQVYDLSAYSVKWYNIAGLVATYGIYTLFFFLILWYRKIINRRDLEIVRSILTRG